MPPPTLVVKGKVIWYPGIFFGRPRPGPDWYFGKGLGLKSNKETEDATFAEPGLVWTTTEQLIIDLEITGHLSGVLSVIEVP